MPRITTSAAVVALLTSPMFAQQQTLAPQFLSESLAYPSSASSSLAPDGLFDDTSAFNFYGFVRLDMQFNDSRMNDPSIPFVVMSEDAAPPVGAPANRLAMAEASQELRRRHFGSS